jgi:transposase
MLGGCLRKLRIMRVRSRGGAPILRSLVYWIEALRSLDEKIVVLDVEILRRAEEDEDARRLKTIPGAACRRCRKVVRRHGRWNLNT